MPDIRACIRVYPEYITRELEHEFTTTYASRRARGTRAELRGRACYAVGGVVREKRTIAVDDFSHALKTLMRDVSRDVRELGNELDARAMGGKNGEANAAARAARAAREFDANHALVNVYERHRGIFPHEDGPMYAAVVAIVSCGSSCAMVFEAKRRAASGEGASVGGDSTSNETLDDVEVFLPARSLLVFYGDAYTKYLHSIADAEEDVVDAVRTMNPEHAPSARVPRTGERVSLTLRQVLNMTKGFEWLTRARG